MDKDLHAFLDRLEAAGELVRVSTAVSRDLEITEVIDRVCKGPAQSNRALLFDHVAGFEMPVAANLFGSPRGWPGRWASRI
jgi:4-hydroxy-3-polyprenylbenzoate decarboxylase